MSNVNTDGLPPEMQARIAQIIEGAKQKAAAEFQPESPHQAAIARPAVPQAPPAPAPPSLMDHTIALRQDCLLYTSPSPRDATLSRMPSSA